MKALSNLVERRCKVKKVYSVGRTYESPCLSYKIDKYTNVG
jgi:hypothetical protein